MSHSLAYILDILAQLVSVLFVARFLLQASRANFYNPISQAIVQITDPVLKPLRLIIPPFRNFDIASLVAVWILLALFDYAKLSIAADYSPGALKLMVLAFFEVLRFILQTYWLLILISIIASFLAPASDHPLLQLIREIVDPILEPARRLIPPLAGLDFSPILVFIVIGLLQDSIIPQITQGVLNAL
ncbi:MAG: YggT family protein [Pseudomonadota bacterium]